MSIHEQTIYRITVNGQFHDYTDYAQAADLWAARIGAIEERGYSALFASRTCFTFKTMDDANEYWAGIAEPGQESRNSTPSGWLKLGNKVFCAWTTIAEN